VSLRLIEVLFQEEMKWMIDPFFPLFVLAGSIDGGGVHTEFAACTPYLHVLHVKSACPLACALSSSSLLYGVRQTQ
jgi:hypothetical protein